tara:strand:- start:932 stop:1270 length:339 start_codon:yes stop_codon:yes gene_type:complete
MNRLEGNDINLRTNDQEEMMLEIMQLLNDTVTPIPDVGMLCTFIYSAKTPGISYDQHPLVVVTEVLKWGFKGFNFHLRKPRQYTWNEIVGQVYIVQNGELDDLLAIPYAKMV